MIQLLPIRALVSHFTFLMAGISLLALACMSGLRADETAPSPCGKTFTVTGNIEHYATPKDVTVEGAPSDDTYAGEVFGPTFTAVVEGLPEGDYTIQIDEAEVYKKGPGQRVMHITSGDTVAGRQARYLRQAGFAKAYKSPARCTMPADSIGGPLTITFTGIKDNAKFNAIHIDDAQGNGVACVKAVDLVDVADATAAEIPAHDHAGNLHRSRPSRWTRASTT